MIMLLLVVCNEPHQKIPSPTKKPTDNMNKQESRRTLIESVGEGALKTLTDKPVEPRLKNYLHVE